MATTRCPDCAEEIRAEAIQCKPCGRWLAGPPGGPGRFVDVDLTPVRVVVAVATVFNGVVLTLILAFVVPGDDVPTY